jgi:hypothetical protein
MDVMTITNERMSAADRRRDPSSLGEFPYSNTEVHAERMSYIVR